MRRINMTFPDSYFVQLQENAAKKGVSVVQYLRNLVGIGLQVEEATTQQTATSSTKNNALSCLSDTKSLGKNMLPPVLESLYLIRYLVDSLDHQPTKEREDMLNRAKEKAQSLGTALLETE